MAREMKLGVFFYGRMANKLRRDVQLMKSTFGSLGKTVTRTSEKMNKQISGVYGGVERLTAAMKVTAAYGLAATAIYSVINAWRTGTKTIVDFHQALKNLQAIVGSTDAELGVMEDVIRRVARTTKFSTTEVAGAAIILGQAGFNTAESLDAINAVAMLATGTLSDMKNTADLLTTSIRAFGLDASKASEIADIMATAVNKSKLTIDKIRTAFNYLGPVAHKAGLSIHESAAGMMALANAGLRGSTIGTGFRRVLASLLAPTKRVREALAASGADMEKLNPRMASLAEIAQELARIIPNASKAFELFGLRGASVAATLAKTGAEGIREMLAEVYYVGRAAEMANKQMEGLGVMAKNLKDRLGDLAISLGEGGVATAFELLLKFARPAVTVLSELASTIVGKVIVAVTSLTIVLVALKWAIRYVAIELGYIVLGKTIADLKTMTKGLGVLNIALGILYKSVTKILRVIKLHPIIAAISVLIVSLVALKRHYAGLAQEVEENIIKTERHIKSLDSYKKEVQAANKDSMAYEAILQRLSNDYPELAENLDIAKDAKEDWIAVIDEWLDRKYAEKIKQQVDLIHEYGNQVDRARNLIVQLIPKLQEMWKEWDFFKHIKKESREFWEETQAGAYGSKEVAEATAKAVRPIGKAFQWAGDQIKELKRITTEYLEDMGEETPQAKEAAKKRQEAIARLGRDLYEKGITWRNSVKEVKELLVEQGAAEERAARHSHDIQWWLVVNRKKLDREKIKSMVSFMKKSEDTSEERFEAIQKLQELEYDLMNDYEEAAKDRDDKLEDLDAGARARWGQAYKDEKKYNELRGKILDEYAKKIRELDDKKASLAERERAREQRRLREFIQTQNKLQSAFEKTERAIIERELRAIEDLQEALMRGEVAVADYNDKLEITRTLFGEIGGETGASALDRIKDYDKILSNYADKQRELWEASAVSAEEYAERLRQALIYLKTDVEGYGEDIRYVNEQIITATGTLSERINLGFRQAAIESGKFGELIVRLGQETAMEFATGFTDAFFDFIEGTKSMGQAFQAFARDFFRMTTEILTRWALLKALGAVSGVVSGTSGTGGEGTWGAQFLTPEQTNVAMFHRSGIVGKDDVPMRKIKIDPSEMASIPRYHEGLRRDERLGILKDDEGVFTPAQMKALGLQEVNIMNITDPRIVDQYMYSIRGKKAILNAIGSQPLAIKRILQQR